MTWSSPVDREARDRFGGRWLAVSAAAVLLSAPSAHAQGSVPPATGARADRPSPGLAAVGALGPVVLDGRFGLEGAAGVQWSRGRVLAAARVLELALLPGEAEPGFRWERLADGQRRCREVASGRFAADTRCLALVATLAASAEALWSVTAGGRPLRLGGGLRLGEASGPYGLVRWGRPARSGPGWHLRASAGPSLLRLGFGLQVRP